MYNNIIITFHIRPSMKKIIYQNLYNLLSVLSGKVNNRHINKLRITIGTTLLLLTSGCQTSKKDNNDKSTNNIHTASGQSKKIIKKNIPHAECSTHGDHIQSEIILPPPPITDQNMMVCYIVDEKSETDDIDDTIFCYVVETMPEFPGGTAALMQFIKDNIKYTKEMSDTTAQGRVIVQFVIDEGGSVINPVVVRHVDPTLDQIALDVIRKLPKWKPGEMKGIPTKIKYTIPITFTK